MVWKSCSRRRAGVSAYMRRASQISVFTGPTYTTRAYNKFGSQQSANYRFPFNSNQFDFIFLTSVFTHMLPADLTQYTSEIARVLKPSGRCLITYFLLNLESEQLIEAGRSTIGFPIHNEGCRLKDADIPEAAIAYPKPSEIYTGGMA